MADVKITMDNSAVIAALDEATAAAERLVAALGAVADAAAALKIDVDEEDE